MCCSIKDSAYVNELLLLENSVIKKIQQETTTMINESNKAIKTHGNSKFGKPRYEHYYWTVTIKKRDEKNIGINK